MQGLNYGVPTGGVPAKIDAKSLTGLDGAWERPFNQRIAPNAPEPLMTDATTKIIAEAIAKEVKKHNHYFKDVTHLTTIDVYRVLELFKVTDQCIGHAVKKLLVAGGRGAGKDINKDIQEAIDSLLRWQEMRKEDANV